MLRRRIKHTKSFEERLEADAIRLRERARTMLPGAERELLLRKARQTETAVHINDWLSSPGLAPGSCGARNDWSAGTAFLFAAAAAGGGRFCAGPASCRSAPTETTCDSLPWDCAGWNGTASQPASWPRKPPHPPAPEIPANSRYRSLS